MKLYLLLFSFFFLFSCSKEQQQQHESSGGSLTMALDNQPSTYLPRKVLDYYSATVLYQTTEGLVGLDAKTLKISPRIASEWVISDSGKKYEFTIREDVLFHPNSAFKKEEDRKMTTDDIVHSFELACSANEDNSAPPSYFMIFKSLLKGADDFYEKKSKSISGLTVEGNKLTIELIHEDKNFLNKLANVCAFVSSKKLYDAGYETEKVGTGPFMYSEFKDGEEASLILTKNNAYYLKDDEGNAIPYLDSVVFVFQSRKMEQLEHFESGKIDFIVGLPTSRITAMIEGRIQDFNATETDAPKLLLKNNPLLESHFYYFNMTDERFKNPLVRQAFNYAVDRETIGRDILRNQYYELGYYGVIPPISKALRGYDFTSVKDVGYTFDPEMAKKLLAQAGYPDGKGFGSVSLRYSINDVHSAVADEFSRQMFKVLGINVNIDGSNFEQLNDDGENGRGEIFRMGWAADYPSPESFLMNFYGDNVPENPNEASQINKARYKNYLFDEFFDQARNAEKMSDQMELFSKAEVELMKDPPIIPLWYTGDIQISQSYVRKLDFNAINYFNFRTVYIKEWTLEEYKKSFKLATK
ncbi:MAG: peptide ABC transporter substrate-binding protein [Fluviicola sp.]|nr:peptide ABC transporter substrate-binding protein [Fluviicola sp.]